MKILWVIGLSLLSGVLGRMGGANDWNTKWRDLGIPTITIGLILWLHPISFNLWVILGYIFSFGLLFSALTTYWDWLFDGWDCMWFSGFIIGLSTIPCMLIGINLYNLTIRAILLGIIWGLVNRYIPNKLLIWRRDVAEEFLRYAFVVATIPILLI